MHLFQMHTVEREEPRLALTGQDDVGSLALSGGDFDNVLALIGEALDMPPEFMLALTSPEIGPALGHQQMQQLVQLFFRRQVFRFVKDTSMGRDQLFFEVNIGAMQRLFVDLNKRRQETGAIGWAKDDLDEPIPKKVQLAYFISHDIDYL